MANALEQPNYAVVNVISEVDAIEVRKYDAYIVAEAMVPGPATEAGSQGFSILGGYIFGKNKGERVIEMTAPVTQTNAPAKIAMTAPVTQAAVGTGFLVQFMMPRAYTLETLPKPIDARIRFREVPAKRVIAIRFSGTSGQTRFNEHLTKLKESAAKAGLALNGEPTFSRYDSPFTLPFMRRNEVWIDVL